MPQTDKKILYPKVASKYNIPLELVESVGDIVFKSWAEWQKKPDNLILNIKAFGRQYMRYKKTLTKKNNMFRKNYDYSNIHNNIFEDEFEKEQYLWQKEWMDNIEERLGIYKNSYLEELKEVKRKRSESAKYLDPIKLKEEREAAKTKAFEF